MSTGTPLQRPRAPRGDAQRNRRRLLDEAGRLVAERGVAASLDEIARRAEVSSGTLYRHFPTRDELFRALYDRVMDRTATLAERVLAEPRAWDGIVAYLDGIVGLASEFPETSAIIAWMRATDPRYRPGDEWVAPMLRLAERAREEGELRADAIVTDVAYAPHLLLGIVRWPEPERGILLARMRALVLDALRDESVPRDPLPALPLSVDQLRALSENPPAPGTP